jgi:hypothetical protein
MSGSWMTAQWVDELGTCMVCKKRPATGTLMGTGSVRLGPVCTPCGKSTLKAAGVKPPQRRKAR